MGPPTASSSSHMLFMEPGTELSLQDLDTVDQSSPDKHAPHNRYNSTTATAAAAAAVNVKAAAKSPRRRTAAAAAAAGGGGQLGGAAAAAAGCRTHWNTGECVWRGRAYRRVVKTVGLHHTTVLGGGQGWLICCSSGCRRQGSSKVPLANNSSSNSRCRGCRSSSC